MGLRVVGAGLPRTGTGSLKVALERLLGGSCCHMSTIAGHPFHLGAGWDGALADQPTDWPGVTEGYVASVDLASFHVLTRAERGVSRGVGGAVGARFRRGLVA